MAREGSFGVKAAVEAANIGGSTAATSVATGENGFTFEAMLQNVLMNRIGGLRDAVTGGPAGGRPAAGDGTAPATTPRRATARRRRRRSRRARRRCPAVRRRRSPPGRR